MTDVLGRQLEPGILVPSTNSSVQPEMDGMRPDGVTNHVPLQVGASVASARLAERFEAKPGVPVLAVNLRLLLACFARERDRGPPARIWSTMIGVSKH